ncbi:MAG: M20/M25/M40 family metallo-hydrolase, partial [Bacilli bacterium]
NGFIKSRFLDDKAQVALLMILAKNIIKSNIILNNQVDIYFTMYEEIGHGGSSIKDDLIELVAVDMACVGAHLAGSEFKVSICTKDSTGPYDYLLSSKLINLAKEANINYAIDIYPFYGSDASLALRAGNDVKIALVGPGVDSSHGNERTHFDGLKATYELLYKYLI